MNTNLSYAPDVKKVGFADIENIQFVNTLQLTPDEQKDIYYTSANRCRGAFIPTWANENQYFPSSIPPVDCSNNANNEELVILLDNNTEIIDVPDSGIITVSDATNVQDLTVPPNKISSLELNKKDILIFVMIGAGFLIIYNLVD